MTATLLLDASKTEPVPPPFALDTDLMLRVKAGEHDCLGDLLHRHRVPVVNFLYRMVQNEAIAEELAQDAFVRVYQSRARYEPTAKFSTWLYRIAAHLALNYLRDSRREKNDERLDDVSSGSLRREIADRNLSVDQDLMHQEMIVRLRQAIAELPDRQRAVVLMHKYQEMDYRQIAEALGTTVSSVKALMFRACASLRGRLATLQQA
ncbi:MAG: RNA polymerase sigma factor [Acidobacteriia bacterium]|nr:RNA polymerase sigma factor [Terriglobia bacterium]